MDRPCAECPWRRDAQRGKFPRRRYLELRDTCIPGGMPGKLFACHMSPEGGEVACAGMLLVVGERLTRVRMMILRGLLDLTRLSSDVPLYSSFDEMAEANGLPPPPPNPNRRGRP